MVLSAIWTLAFGVQNPLPDTLDEDFLDHSYDQDYDEDEEGAQAILDHETKVANILGRQREVTDAQHNILGTTVHLPTPSIRDEVVENKSGFILVVTSLTLNNIGCYPFFGIRDRHQVFPKLFPETSPRSSFQYLRQVYRSQGALGIWRSQDGGRQQQQQQQQQSGQRHRRQQQQQQQQQQQPAADNNGTMTVVTANEISATIMAAMPTLSSNSPASTTVAVNRARRGLRYLSAVTPRNPTLLQEFYPEMVCAMTSSMITRVLLYPLDTVASRVSAQGGSFPGIGCTPVVYSGFWDCWIRSIRSEGGGLSGLYSGVMDCIIIEAMVRWVVLEGTWFAHLVIKWIHRR
ncbi:hypothetical protein EDD11_001227 [Mortierella claussenii]|nr:hypothetical protein EDD11_001227 [Mortierella claussenii]